jgi:hypothetical protein
LPLWARHDREREIQGHKEQKSLSWLPMHAR